MKVVVYYYHPVTPFKIMFLKRWTDQQLDDLAAKVQALCEMNVIVDDLSKKIKGVVQQQENIAISQQKMLSLFERMGLQQEKIIEAQGLLTENQANLANSIKQLAESQMQVTKIVESMDDKLNSTRAAVERLDRIMDYLMRRDTERDINLEDGTDRD